MKLEVGMYIRTNLGEIGKVTSIATDNIFDDCDLTFYNSEPFLKGKEVKFDWYILNLIKPGDFVNGQLVVSTGYNIFDEWCVTVRPYNWNTEYIYPDEIETILTKEQYEANCFRLKGDSK